MATTRPETDVLPAPAPAAGDDGAAPSPIAAGPIMGPWRDRRLWQITPVRDAIGIALVTAVVVLVLWVGYELRAIFTPVLIGLALAYLFDPIITAGERRWNMPRPVTIAVLLAVTGLIIAGFVAWLGPKFVEQVRSLAHATPAYIERLSERSDIHLDAQTRAAIKKVADDPVAFLHDSAGLLFKGTGQAVGFIGGLLGTTTYILAVMVLVPIYFYFFAWKYGPLLRFLQQYLPASRRDRILIVLRRMDSIVAAYFRARVIIAIIMGGMFAIGWAAVGVPYWLLLGLCSGLASIIPLGQLIGWPLAVGLKWLAVTNGPDGLGFDWMAVVFWPSAVYLVVHVVEAWVLTPLIQGKSLHISAVTVILALLVGGSVGGLYGLLLCIPIVACTKVLLIELVLPRVRLWAARN